MKKLNRDFRPANSNYMDKVSAIYRYDNGVLIVAFLISFFFHLILITIYPWMDVGKKRRHKPERMVVELIPTTPLKTHIAVEKIKPEVKPQQKRTVKKPTVKKQKVTKKTIKKISKPIPKPKSMTREQIMSQIMKNMSIDKQVTPKKTQKSLYHPVKQNNIPAPQKKTTDKKPVSERGVKKTKQKEIPVIQKKEAPIPKKPIVPTFSMSKLSRSNTDKNFIPNLKTPLTSMAGKPNRVAINREPKIARATGISMVPSGNGEISDDNNLGISAPPAEGPKNNDDKSILNSIPLKPENKSTERRIVYQPPDPEMPGWVTEKGISPVVKLEITIEPNGRVSSVRFIIRTGYPELDTIAENQVRKWIFAKDEYTDIIKFRYNFNNK